MDLNFSDVDTPEDCPAAFEHPPEDLKHHDALMAWIIKTLKAVMSLEHKNGVTSTPVILEKTDDVECKDENGTIFDHPAYLTGISTSRHVVRTGLEMGFDAAYFVPAPYDGEITHRTGLPKEIPDSWLKVDVAAEDHQTRIVLPRDAVGLHGHAGALLLKPRTGTQALLMFAQMLKEHPEMFPLHMGKLIIEYPESLHVTPENPPIDGLTSEQSLCVHSHEANDATFIWGPPGTGKSQVLTRIIRSNKDHHRTVLFCANANDAVNSVALKIVGSSDYDDIIDGGAIARFGQCRIKSLKCLASQQGVVPQIALATIYSSLVRATADPASMVADTVLVDEAGMVSPPILYMLACLARKKIVICGDPAQGDPVFEARPSDIGKATHAKWATNVYERLNFRIHPGDVPDPRVLKLTTQFRMHDSLAELVRRTHLYPAYNSSPTPPTPSGDELAALSCDPLPHRHFVFVDTSDLPSTFSKDNENPAHAAIVSQLTASYIDHARLNKVGIVTPYRNQANAYHLFEKVNHLTNHMICGTSHRFQGSECPLVIFDTVEAPPHPDNTRAMSHFWTDDISNKQAAKILNVSVSRAKSKFIVVGHIDYLRHHLSPNCFMHRMIDYAEQEGVIVPANNLSYPSVPDGSTQFPEDPTVVESEQFWEVLLQDISRACASVNILSPKISLDYFRPFMAHAAKKATSSYFNLFMHQNMTNETRTYLSELQERNPKLRVFPKDEWQWGDSFVCMDHTLMYAPHARADVSPLSGEVPERTVRLFGAN